MAAISPAGNRFDYASAMHPTSSLRDPPPNATPPGGRSRSQSAAQRSGDEHDERRKGKGRERDEPADQDGQDAHGRPEKRSRTGARSGRHVDSPVSNNGAAHSPSSGDVPAPSSKGRPSGLAPIKPIGFAASREARREEGGDQPIPSPVVMGFDFKSIDEDQLKTVRDTISIKEQQQALIAQRRKEMAASQPSTPRELTFKGWMPKDPESRGVGARREKTRDKVERMSIVTSASDKDVVPGSKSAPLNQGLASQQQSPHEPPSGSQTAMPQHILPPMHYHPHSAHHLPDPRTAPISHARSRGENDFGRQQQPYYQAQQQQQPRERDRDQQQSSRDQHQQHRSNPLSGVPSSNSQQQHRLDTRYPPELGSRSGRQPNTADRRNFSVPSIQHPGSQPHSGPRYPPSPHSAQHQIPPGPLSGALRPSNGVHRQNGGYSLSPSPPPGHHAQQQQQQQQQQQHQRDQFLQPFTHMFDIVSSVEQLRYQLQDLIHRSDQAYATQAAATNEFKNTTAQASSLLGTLQQSADSLKEMVRYEVDRALGGERREVDELRDRVRQLEERLASHK